MQLLHVFRTELESVKSVQLVSYRPLYLLACSSLGDFESAKSAHALEALSEQEGEPHCTVMAYNGWEG